MRCDLFQWTPKPVFQQTCDASIVEHGVIQVSCMLTWTESHSKHITAAPTVVYSVALSLRHVPISILIMVLRYCLDEHTTRVHDCNRPDVLPSSTWVAFRVQPS